MTTAARLCILCDQEMRPKTVEDVEVDYCPKCHGLWLDRNEIQRLADKSDEALGELRALIDEGDDSDGAIAPQTEHVCPACGGKFTLAQFGAICIRHCMICDGIFLERGELDKAMQVFKSHESTTIVALAHSVVARGCIES